ncbi:MAG: type II toxin-antitoxin system death-on-curing family toxin [Rhodospirillaceae bacterium]|nr:MAG: type II toxin-antitoxin system death-on-curing family toxin [Rhodospirillaceae bacterium]
MREPVWIEKEALVLLHGASLARFGGVEGIRDEGLLDAALARPINKFHYAQSDNEPSDLADLAAAYAFGLVKNHPFVDGNKRAAFLACGIFLAVNGKNLDAPAAETVAAVMALADGSVNEREFALWIRRHW